MPLTFSKVLSKNLIINFIFSFIPISFIAGNLLLNANILLLILTSFIFYNKDIFTEKISIIDKFVIIFFVYILIIGVYTNSFFYFSESFNNDFTIAVKTLSYMRYLLLYFVVKYLILKNILDLKIFFISSATCSLFVSLDIIYQFIF